MIPALIVLALVLGGGGVVAASDNAAPGDVLFPVDVAVEKARIRFADDDKKKELEFKFAEERVAEIKKITEETKAASVLVTDLSKNLPTEIEVDVFTNETVVKIEAGDKRYGFITAAKTEAAVVAEIAKKYSLTEAQVKSVFSFETEDRESRANDLGFLNRLNSPVFSEKESEDISESLSGIQALLDENATDPEAKELRAALAQIIAGLKTTGRVEIEIKDDEIKIKSDAGKVEIKKDEIKAEFKNNKVDDDAEDDDADESDDDSDESDDDSSDDDSDDDESDDDEDDSDESNDDDEDEDEDESDDDEDEDESDDDNSGSGNSDDDDN